MCWCFFDEPVKGEIQGDFRVTHSLEEQPRGVKLEDEEEEEW